MNFKNLVCPNLLKIEGNYLKSLKQENVNYTIFDVPIGNNYIHTLKAEPNIIKFNIPILLLHGFTGSLVNWKSVIPLLIKSGYIVYAIDILGWGLSSRPQNFSNWELLSKLLGKTKNVNDVCDLWVNSIEEWRKKLEIDKIHIVGHSLGGWIAGEYSLHYPNNIAKVSLVCSVGVYKHDKTWFGDRIGVLGIFMEFTRGLFGINWPFKLLRFIDFITCKHIFNMFVSENYMTYIRAINSLPPSGEIIAEYIKRRSDPNDSHVLWDRLDNINYPITLIYCECDKTVPGFDSSILSKLKKSPLIDISTIGYGAGHSSLDKNVIEAFVASILGNTIKDEYMKKHPDGIKYSLVKRLDTNY